jgi:hypothetical protein
MIILPLILNFWEYTIINFRMRWEMFDIGADKFKKSLKIPKGRVN